MRHHQTGKLLGESNLNALLDERCLHCGAVLGAAILSGLCPKCMLQRGCQAPTAEDIESVRSPSLELIAESMRGLFQPIEFTGRGGMGAVYKGYHCKLNGFVALKIMQPRTGNRAGIKAAFHRFKREARLQARLTHRNVVAIYDFGLAGNFLYLTMDFVDGSSLRQMLQSGPLKPSTAVKLFVQLCDGLQHAHESGVIHRDIKPENLLVDKESVLKIADFGLAKFNGEGETNEWTTLDSGRIGTPHYMAPEQIEKPHEVDHRADIYSAGVVLYEMLTGGLPLGLFSRPSQKVEVDSSFDAVLFRALNKDVARRYRNVREFKQAVEAVFNKDELTQDNFRSDLGYHSGHFADQLAQWAEAVLGKADLERHRPRIRGQLAQWAEVVATRRPLRRPMIRSKKLLCAIT